jgi:hypothetical protein
MPVWRRSSRNQIHLMPNFLRQLLSWKHVFFFQTVRVYRHCDNKIWQVYDDGRELEIYPSEYADYLKSRNFVQIDFSIPDGEEYKGKYTVLWAIGYSLDFTELNKAEQMIKEWFKTHVPTC